MSSTENEVSCADVLKVLADETRLTVVRQLLRGPRYVGEMNDELQIDKTLLSHHLKVLRDAGIVEAERDGKAMLYRLAPEFESKRSGTGLDLGCCQLVFG